MIISLLGIAVGALLLFFGADYFVKGSASLSKRLNISPLVIGLTVVAFGTSAPELAVNLVSAINGNTDLAIGNVIGSNIGNILLILGLSAVISPLVVRDTTVKLEVPYMIATSIVLVLLGITHFGNTLHPSISALDGLVLILFFIVFLIYTLLLSRNRPHFDEEISLYSALQSLVMGGGGLIVLLVGAKLLADSAVILAEAAGMSQALIGLTIVAIGTSLPELATSVVAALRRQNDIAIGNVIGSNIFNVLWVLGATSVIRPLPIANAIQIDLIINIAVSILLYAALFVFSKNKLGRIEGTILLMLYISYLTYIIARG